ncbi:MAG: hypothetical protein ABIJ18_04015 [archaeon]
MTPSTYETGYNWLNQEERPVYGRDPQQPTFDYDFSNQPTFRNPTEVYLSLARSLAEVDPKKSAFFAKKAEINIAERVLEIKLIPIPVAIDRMVA